MDEIPTGSHRQVPNLPPDADDDLLFVVQMDANSDRKFATLLSNETAKSGGHTNSRSE
jgi:hypothetical protein